MSERRKGWRGPLSNMHVSKGWNGPLGSQQKAWDVVRKHGMWNTPTYKAWQAMFQRCYNPKCKAYPNWGGRGVRVCERWKSFPDFLADMGPRPEGTSIDRWPDNSGNYEPGNCRWATPEEQHNNKRSNHLVIFNGETRTIAQWARRRGVEAHILEHRLKYGWTVEQAFLIPVQQKPLISAKIVARWTRELGLSHPFLGMRLAKGWSVERALVEPILIHGKTIAALARESGISRNTIRRRLALGWPLERLTEAKHAYTEPRRSPRDSAAASSA